jgi:hypothetical protein
MNEQPETMDAGRVLAIVGEEFPQVLALAVRRYTIEQQQQTIDALRAALMSEPTVQS